MRPSVTHRDILTALVNQALRTPDAPARRIVQGASLIGVESRQVGLASRASALASDQTPFALTSLAPGSADSTHALARPKTARSARTRRLRRFPAARRPGSGPRDAATGRGPRGRRATRLRRFPPASACPRAGA